MFDDLEPPPKKKHYTLGDPLDRLSVSELGEIIGDLKTEIIRLESDIEKKNQTSSAAEALFKKGG